VSAAHIPSGDSSNTYQRRKSRMVSSTSRSFRSRSHEKSSSSDSHTHSHSSSSSSSESKYDPASIPSTAALTTAASTRKVLPLKSSSGGPQIPDSCLEVTVLEATQLTSYSKNDDLSGGTFCVMYLISPASVHPSHMHNFRYLSSHSQVNNVHPFWKLKVRVCV
jgi:hypothetical protein